MMSCNTNNLLIMLLKKRELCYIVLAGVANSYTY